MGELTLREVFDWECLHWRSDGTVGIAYGEAGTEQEARDEAMSRGQLLCLSIMRRTLGSDGKCYEAADDGREHPADGSEERLDPGVMTPCEHGEGWRYGHLVVGALPHRARRCNRFNATEGRGDGRQWPQSCRRTRWTS